MTLEWPEHKFHKMKFSNFFSLLALFEKKNFVKLQKNDF